MKIPNSESSNDSYYSDFYVDVVNDESIDIKALNFSVRFGILEETEEMLAGFFWPATL